MILARNISLLIDSYQLRAPAGTFQADSHEGTEFADNPIPCRRHYFWTGIDRLARVSSS
jgi:hypothetical protein